MTFLIVQISGKQFILKKNEWYDIDYINNSFLNQYLQLNKILFYKKENKIQIGKPFLNNTFILVKILQHFKGPKITILKTKPKKKYTRIKGHRQVYTRIKISNFL
jgi:large subunit ribosomal protein L21